MSIDNLEKIKNIVKDVLDMTTKNRSHNSSRVHLFGVGLCISIACFFIICVLKTLEIITLPFGLVILKVVICVYIFLVVHIKKGSVNLMNIYNMVTTDNHMDHKIIRRQFQDNLNGNIEFKKKFNIVQPNLWHRLYYDILFSNNENGSYIVEHYKRHICKKGNNPIIIEGYINISETSVTLYDYNINISFWGLDMNKCKEVIGIRLISDNKTSNLMPLVDIIRTFTCLIKQVINMNYMNSYSEIIDLFTKINNCELTTNVVDFNSNVVFPVCEYISRALIDINNNTQLKSTEYFELCKLVSICGPKNINLENIWISKALSDIQNSDYSKKKKKRVVANLLDNNSLSAKPPPYKTIRLFLNKIFKKG